MDLVEVLFCLAEQLFSFAVIHGVLMFFINGLGVSDEIEVTEVLFVLACEVNRHHCGDFIVAGHILGVDESVCGEVGQLCDVGNRLSLGESWGCC